MHAHIIIAAVGSKGDFFPYLAIAKEMKARGFPCTILSHEPYRVYADLEGISFKSIMSSEQSYELLQNPDLWNATKGLEIIFRHAILATTQNVFQEVEAIAKNSKCFLVTTSGLLGSNLARVKYDIPSISLQLAPFTHFSYIDPPKDIPAINTLYKVIGEKGRKMIVQYYYKKFNKILSKADPFILRNGLEPFKNFVGQDRYGCDALVDFWPDWFCPPKPDWPKHSVRVGFLNYEGPKTETTTENWKNSPHVKTFLEEQPLVFAMGSEMRQNIDKMTHNFEAVCRNLDKKGIMVTPTVKGSNKISGHLLQIEYAPFHELFSKASLIVNHGGIGTITRIMSLGKPSIELPMAFDQFDNAFHMKRLGISDYIEFKKMKATNLTLAIKKLLSDAALQNRLEEVRKLASRNEGEKVACDLITQILEGDRA